MSDFENIEQYNSVIRQWQTKVYNEFKGELGRLSIKGKQELLKRSRHPAKIVMRMFEEGVLKRDMKKGKLGKEYGEINSVGFKFPRHGIFEALGVRNRHGINNPVNAKEWRRPFEQNIPALAQKICEMKVDMVLKSATKGLLVDKGMGI
jgi:hypothetical protein